MTQLIAIFGWFFVILTLSLIMSNIYRTIKIPELKLILDILFFIGVVVHELAHACILLCNRVVPTNFQVHYRNRYKGRVSPHGAVKYKLSDEFKLSFLQALLVGLAPLFISTFIFFFMIDIIFNTNCSDLMKNIAGIVMVSVVFGSSPSSADLNNIARSFKRRPEYSLYQILLAIIAILIVMFYIDLNKLIFSFEVQYYIINCLMAISIYGGLKFTLLGIKTMILGIANRIRNQTQQPKLPLPYYNPEFSTREEDEWKI